MSNNTSVSVDTIEKMTTTIHDLVNMIQQLTDEYHDYRRNIDRIIEERKQEPIGDLVITKFSTKPEPKNFRIFPEVSEKLEQIKKKYPSYNTQSIINSILYEGINKYLTEREDDPMK